MTARTRTALAAALAAAALTVAACGSEVESSTQAATTAPLATTAPVPTAPATVTAPVATTPTVPTATAPAATAPASTPPASTGPATADEQAVRDAIQSYVDAFVNADGARACGLLTQQVQQAFLSQVQSQVDATSCADAFSKIAQLATDEQRSAFRDARITGVRVSGDSATATIAVAGISNQVQLQREDGAWRIANLPGS